MSFKVSMERDSSVECFRILATFLVLLVHFAGWFVGGVSEPYDTSLPLSFRMGQMLMEALGVVCVNCFLIISGWYGIKLKFSAVWKMYVLIFFVYVPFQIISYVLSGTFSIRLFLDNVLVFVRESYFVQCYTMLMFLSPMINLFIEKHGRNAKNYVLMFWLIEILLESVWDNKSLGFENGYSLIHFVLIYMLARVVSLYKNEILSVKKHWWILGYLFCVSVVCLMHLVGYKHTWDYSNPIVVLESFCLFFPFLYHKFHNKTVNWLAGSSFAVYIMHTCSPMIDYLRLVDNFLLNNYSYVVYLIGICIIMVLTFVVCVLYDKLRIYLTKDFTDKIFSFITSKIKFSLYGE